MILSLSPLAEETVNDKVHHHEILAASSFYIQACLLYAVTSLAGPSAVSACRSSRKLSPLLTSSSACLLISTRNLYLVGQTSQFFIVSLSFQQGLRVPCPTISYRRH